MTESERQHWRTPPRVIEPMRQFARMAGLGEQIALDPCSGPGAVVNARVELVRAQDGLSEDWVKLAAGGLIYVNPPYSNVRPWIERCEVAGQSTDVIALVNAATSDGWWRWAPAVLFWRGRIKFLMPDGSPGEASSRWPSASPYWGPNVALFEHVFAPFGRVVRAAL